MGVNRRFHGGKLFELTGDDQLRLPLLINMRMRKKIKTISTEMYDVVQLNSTLQQMSHKNYFLDKIETQKGLISTKLFTLVFGRTTS